MRGFMSTKGVTFGPWHPLERALAAAPSRPGLLQLRADALLAFPRGKSAMVLYAATKVDETLVEFVEGRGGPRLARAAACGACLVRFAEAALPEVELERLLQRFTDRFGASPPANAGMDAGVP
jgi:hypothetical protein